LSAIRRDIRAHLHSKCVPGWEPGPEGERPRGMITTVRLRTVLRLLAVLAFAALVACGSPTSTAPEPRAGGDGPDTPVSSTPRDDEAPTNGPRRRLVVPEPGMDNVRPVSWESIRGIDPTTLMVRFTSGVKPCHVLDHVDIEYGRRHIAITLFEGNDPGAGDVACIEIAELQRVRVELDEPIGDRRLVDGAR
jgi:hypothetical protein